MNAVLSCAKGRDVLDPNLAAGLAGEIRPPQRTRCPGAQPAGTQVLDLISKGRSIPAHGQGAVPGSVDGEDPRATSVREAWRE